MTPERLALLQLELAATGEAVITTAEYWSLTELEALKYQASWRGDWRDNPPVTLRWA